MSSLGRRIQRQVSPSQEIHPKITLGKVVGLYANPPRHVFFGKNLFHGGRGSRLGVVNEKDPARIARMKRDAKWGRG